MMKIITGGRLVGKTHRLIEECAKHGGYIVCRSKQNAAWISQRAEELGLDIPYPITHGEFLRGAFVGRNIPYFNIPYFYVDDLDILLQTVARGVQVKSAAFSGEIEKLTPPYLSGEQLKTYKEALENLATSEYQHLILGDWSKLEDKGSQNDE